MRKSMNINIINTGRLLMAALAVGAGLAMASCSSNDEPDSPKFTDPEVTYKGNVAYSKGILFNDGKELGNGLLRHVRIIDRCLGIDTEVDDLVSFREKI